jgi:hypothetical protein
MHFLTTAFSLLCFTAPLQVLAAPLTFTDIERRWSAGETDVSALRLPSQHQPHNRNLKPLQTY